MVGDESGSARRNEMAQNINSMEGNTLVGRVLRASQPAEMDQALMVLRSNKDAWAQMDIRGRIVLLG